MKALLVLFAAVGAAAGAVLGVVEHQRAAAGTGWTFYLPMQRRYADYLPVNRGPWWPGLAEYIGVGIAAGVLVAVVVLAFGFRLSRPPRPAR